VRKGTVVETNRSGETLGGYMSFLCSGKQEEKKNVGRGGTRKFLQSRVQPWSGGVTFQKGLDRRAKGAARRNLSVSTTGGRKIKGRESSLSRLGPPGERAGQNIHERAEIQKEEMKAELKQSQAGLGKGGGAIQMNYKFRAQFSNLSVGQWRKKPPREKRGSNRKPPTTDVVPKSNCQSRMLGGSARPFLGKTGITRLKREDARVPVGTMGKY